jgi:mono/diheme cytochrome c family protein
MLKSKKQQSAISNQLSAFGSKRTFACSLLAAYCLLFAIGCRMDMQDQPRYEVYEPSTFFKDGLASRPLVEGTVARGYLKEDTEFHTGKIARNQNGGATTSGQNAGGTRTSGDDAAQQEGQTSIPQTARDNPSATTGSDTPGNTTQGNGTARTGGAANQAGGGGGGGTAQGDPNDVETFPFPITAEIVERGEERYKIYCAMCHGATGYGDGMIVRRGFRKPPSYHTNELRTARVGHLFDVITNGWGSMPSYSTQVPARDRWAIIAYVRALQLSQQNVTAENAPAPENSGARLPNTGGPK